jgi:hypothetical protein
MAPLPRIILSDFQRDIAARGINGGTSKNLYASSLNSDGTTLTVTKNGQPIFNKVLWQGSGGGFISAATDASGSFNRDSVVIYSPDGATSVGSAQAFLNNLV